jgi:acetate kinase
MADERSQLKAWFSRTDKELNEINRNGEFDEKVSKASEAMRQAKKEHREVYYKVIEKRKALIAQHERVVNHSKLLKQMQEQIESRRTDQLMAEEEVQFLKTVTPESLAQMRTEIEKAKRRIKQGEEKLEEETINQEEEIGKVEHEIKLLKLRNKEAQQIISLSNLKIKELSRRVRFNTLKPLRRKQKSMDQGRREMRQSHAHPLTI